MGTVTASASDSARQAARVAAHAADTTGAERVEAYDVSGTLAIADIMLIASADNERLVLAAAEHIERELALALGRMPRSREGVAEGQWILLDYGDLIVHVMHDEAREFYRLERLWDDGEAIDLRLEVHDE